MPMSAGPKIFSEPPNILLPNLVSSVMHHYEPDYHAEILVLLSSRSRLQRGLIWSNCDCSYYNFWTTDPFATKLFYGILLLKKQTGLLCSRSRSQWNSICQLMFLRTISSEPLNRLSPNLARWCIIISQSVVRNDWFALFKVNGTVKAHMVEIWLSSICSELLIILQATFDLMAHHPTLGCPLKRMHCCVVLKVKVEAKVTQWVWVVYRDKHSQCQLYCTFHLSTVSHAVNALSLTLLQHSGTHFQKRSIFSSFFFFRSALKTHLFPT